jgi:hypothetical protein
MGMGVQQPEFILAGGQVFASIIVTGADPVQLYGLSLTGGQGFWAIQNGLLDPWAGAIRAGLSIRGAITIGLTAGAPARFATLGAALPATASAWAGGQARGGSASAA